MKVLKGRKGGRKEGGEGGVRMNGWKGGRKAKWEEGRDCGRRKDDVIDFII